MIGGFSAPMTVMAKPVHVVLAACAIAVGCFTAAQAAPARPFTQWQNGDLIFQQSTGSQTAAVLEATGSRFTHMGIVQIRNRQVTVIEAQAQAQVTETPLDRFIARGRDGRYAVYRVRGLKPVQWAVVQFTARLLYGKPYDIFFRSGADAIYCSELPYLAFKSANIELGKPHRLGELAVQGSAVRALFLKRWQTHPDCRGLGAEACWRKIQDQRLVTPASIARDPNVALVYSNF